MLQPMPAVGAYDLWTKRRSRKAFASDGHCADGHHPARSVVNEGGRSHDVKNLFIVDGSIVVTSAGVNPTWTIQALALYVASLACPAVSIWPTAVARMRQA
jgi:choline dehydrogenase-like flavoprotein